MFRRDCSLTKIVLAIAGLLSIFSFLFLSAFVKAEDYSSSNFILRDSVITIGGGNSTSTSFQLFNASGQLVQGESTSTSFTHWAGFLYFPQATSPVLTATAGDQQVTLNWTASTGALGNITNYRVGTSTVSGGPYVFASVGDVLTYVKTGLTNGTTYYFRVQVQVGDEILAQSAEASATPAAPAACGNGSCSDGETCSTCPADCGACPGGGGGGGAYIPPATTVIFSGRAYPKSAVTLLKDAQVAATTVAGQDSNFLITLSGLSGGNYIFSVYAEDYKGNRSSLLTFPVSVTAGVTTNVSGIFIAPTIAVDKSEVKRGDNIAIFGQSTPQADIVISVNSDEEFFAKTISDKDGIYLYNFDTAPLAYETHNTKSKALIGNQLISGWSYVVSFKVGTKNVLEEVQCGKADLNCDAKVNLVDFSIAAYWYKRPISASFATIEKERLNGDGKVDLVDFSIMAYYWTG